ncbi:MAG: DUF4258 domain-containing protein [Magnetovibrio sp.]|nr:DUF4258 domain-containing protein [Magnetovibrio sp.]
MKVPWIPAQATETLRSYAVDCEFEIRWTGHARDRMAERELIMGDVLYVLKQGVVLNEAQQATRSDCYKYELECSTPNSNGRTVRVVVIPSPDRPAVKVITIMWVDGK